MRGNDLEKKTLQIISNLIHEFEDDRQTVE